MEDMEIRSAIEDLKNIANEYAQIYDGRFQKIAAQAFMDGMVFAKVVQAGAVTDDMINEDLFRTIREFNQ